MFTECHEQLTQAANLTPVVLSCIPYSAHRVAQAPVLRICPLIALSVRSNGHSKFGQAYVRSVNCV